MHADVAKRMEALYRKAYDLVERDRFIEAKGLLEECLSLGSNPAVDVAARQELARVLRALGDLHGALELRREVKAIAPDRHANLWKLAELLAEMGSLEEALTEVTAALEYEPAHQAYKATQARIKHLLGSSLVFRTHVDRKLGFEVGIPEHWAITNGLRGLLARLIERSVVVATAPSYEGFARMAVGVRKADSGTENRQRNEFAEEIRITVAGVPATQVKYVFAGTTFCKTSVVRGGREYLIQFGHDGSFVPTIDRIVRSFKFL